MCRMRSWPCCVVPRARNSASSSSAESRLDCCLAVGASLALFAGTASAWSGREMAFIRHSLAATTGRRRTSTRWRSFTCPQRGSCGIFNPVQRLLLNFRSFGPCGDPGMNIGLAPPTLTTNSEVTGRVMRGQQGFEGAAADPQKSSHVGYVQQRIQLHSPASFQRCMVLNFAPSQRSLADRHCQILNNHVCRPCRFTGSSNRCK